MFLPKKTSEMFSTRIDFDKETPLVLPSFLINYSQFALAFSLITNCVFQNKTKKRVKQNKTQNLRSGVAQGSLISRHAVSDSSHFNCFGLFWWIFGESEALVSAVS